MTNIAKDAADSATGLTTQFVKFTTHVEFTTSVALTAAAAIGTASITSVQANGNDYFASYYDTTNDVMALLLINSAIAGETILSVADCTDAGATLIGVIPMTGAQYDAFGAHDIEIIA